MGNIKINRVVSASYEVNNQTEESRQYDITAVAKVQNGQLANIEAGAVSTAMGGVVANFSVYNGGLSVSFSGNQQSASQVALLNAINGFKEDVTAKFENFNDEPEI